MISSLNKKLAVVFGASGFVGRYVVAELVRRGYCVRAASRRPDKAYFLRPLGVVGQVEPVYANVRDAASVERVVRGADVGVNLVGILSESGAQKFSALHAQAAQTVAGACAKAQIQALVHVSAIGARADSPSLYARSKAMGENGVLEAFPQAVILRPSIIFGPEDNFFNRFAAMSVFAPFLPLIDGGKTRFQPVYVGDVAHAVGAALGCSQAKGSIYELGGPHIKTFKELLELMLDHIGRKNKLFPHLLPVPSALMSLPARLFEKLPNPLITRDQIALLKDDNVVSDQAKGENRTLLDLGITPKAMESVLTEYLWKYRPHGQFSSKTGKI